MRPPLDVGRAFALAALLAAASACDKPSGSADAGASASAHGNANARADADADAAGPVAVTGLDSGLVSSPSSLPLCRIMASENGPPATADATLWLDLAEHASFTVRTLETGRELRFEGPGRIRACGDDVALVAEGSAVGLPGSGEAPGAEQWVATACGVARWASGAHRVIGGKFGCTVQSSLGTMQLYVAADVTANEVIVNGAPAPGPDSAGDAGPPSNASSPWRRLDGRHALALKPRGAIDGAAGVKAALVACEHAADAVQKIAAAMLAGGPAGDGGTAAGIGELAEQSVVARGVARAACAVAGVRVALAGGSPLDEARLAAASIRWRAGRGGR